MRILILGVNGFIGNALARRVLDTTDHEVYGMDLADDKLNGCLTEEGFRFVEGDISIHHEWVEYHVKKCDVVFPLVAIATPADYVRNPVGVFQLDFEENLRIIRLCVKYGKRVVFPSTSEVYGMCEDEEFDEDGSPLVTGPIHKQRWIYSSLKQLLDRVIWAYGSRGELQYTIFRPFNWIGPKLDSLEAAKIGSSRVVTQFILNLANNEPIRLVDGGEQRRCFTYLDDGIDCLMRIIENANGVCDGQIFNVGNPENECSIGELAQGLWRAFVDLGAVDTAASLKIVHVRSEDYYGRGYQDIMHRRPSIKKAREILGWKPKVDLDNALRKTVASFLSEIERLKSGTTEAHACC